MAVELLPLAQQAMAALQVANQPNWAEVAGLFVSAVCELGRKGGKKHE